MLSVLAMNCEELSEQSWCRLESSIHENGPGSG